MKTFIWERLPNITTHWHPEGGLVVIAESLERAQELIDVDGVVLTEPDLIYACEAVEERTFIFGDTGCCY